MRTRNTRRKWVQYCESLRGPLGKSLEGTGPPRRRRNVPQRGCRRSACERRSVLQRWNRCTASKATCAVSRHGRLLGRGDRLALRQCGGARLRISSQIRTNFSCQFATFLNMSDDDVSSDDDLKVDRRRSRWDKNRPKSDRRHVASSGASRVRAASPCRAVVECPRHGTERCPSAGSDPRVRD